LHVKSLHFRFLSFPMCRVVSGQDSGTPDLPYLYSGADEPELSTVAIRFSGQCT